jgi:surface polysaccharide O-acyltransferase-like enzyme
MHSVQIDLLRVMAAFVVVWVHASAVVMRDWQDLHSIGWWVGHVSRVTGQWSPAVFIMVSGALLLSRPIETNVLGFYRHRAIKLLPSLIFWTMFYSWFSICCDGATTIDALKNLVHGVPYYHLWYLYMIAGLYFIVPLLRLVVKGSSGRELSLFVISGLVISSVENLLTRFQWAKHDLLLSGTFLSLFLQFIPYFVAGYYLYNRPRRASGRLYLLFALVAAGALALGTVPIWADKPAARYSMLDPMAIVMTLCVFQYGLSFQFSSDKMPALLRRIAPTAFGVYLIHPFWLSVLNKFGLNTWLINPMLGIPIMTLAAVGLSAVSVVLLAAFPIMRATVMIDKKWVDENAWPLWGTHSDIREKMQFPQGTCTKPPPLYDPPTKTSQDIESHSGPNLTQ